MWFRGNIEPFWDDEYKYLDYEREPFNDPESVEGWKQDGHNHTHFTGMMCDMRKKQPSWNKQIIDYFYAWNDVCTSYYRMETGNILPMHSDLYSLYKRLFDLDHSATIWRCVILLEDRQEGHILEIEDQILDWEAGDFVIWNDDVRHAAANLGIEDRYTLQVTGWTNEQEIT